MIEPTISSTEPRKEDSDNSVIFRAFKKHFIIIKSIVQMGHEEETNLFSCFLLEVEGRALVITAGHVIDILLKRKEQNAKFAVLDHSERGKDKREVPIVLDENNMQSIRVNNFDYGMIALPELTWRCMLANGKVAVPNNSWKNSPKNMNDFEKIYIFGVPTEGVTPKSHNGKITNIDYQFMMYGAQPIARPPSTIDHPEGGFFYCKLEHQSERDIDGMSGGPAFGVVRESDEKISFWLLGIQSGWVPHRREISVATIAPLAEGFLDAVRKLGEQRLSA